MANGEWDVPGPSIFAVLIHSTRSHLVHKIHSSVLSWNMALKTSGIKLIATESNDQLISCSCMIVKPVYYHVTFIDIFKTLTLEFHGVSVRSPMVAVPLSWVAHRNLVEGGIEREGWIPATGTPLSRLSNWNIGALVLTRASKIDTIEKEAFTLPGLRIRIRSEF